MILAPHALGLLGSIMGCRPVEQAPADLDGLLHYYWAGHESGSDAQLAEATLNLHAVVGADLEEIVDGALSDLSAEEVSQVGRSGDEAGLAAGIYMINAFPCTLSELEPVVIYQDQSELYEGIYDSYDRTYTTDRDAFTAGSSQTLEWEVSYSASVLGTGYQAVLQGGVRRIPTIDAEQSPFGPVLLAWSFLPTPAEFENDEKNLNQDYQIEIYYERTSGELLHAYGLWREADFGAGFSSEDEGVQRLLLNSLADWDAETERLCEEGLP